MSPPSPSPSTSRPPSAAATTSVVQLGAEADAAFREIRDDLNRPLDQPVMLAAPDEWPDSPPVMTPLDAEPAPAPEAKSKAKAAPKARKTPTTATAPGASTKTASGKSRARSCSAVMVAHSKVVLPEPGPDIRL